MEEASLCVVRLAAEEEEASLCVVGSTAEEEGSAEEEEEEASPCSSFCLFLGLFLVGRARDNFLLTGI